MLLCRRLHSQVHPLKTNALVLARNRHSKITRTTQPSGTFQRPDTSPTNLPTHAEGQVQFRSAKAGLIPGTLAGYCSLHGSTQPIATLKQVIGAGDNNLIQDMARIILEQHDSPGTEGSQSQALKLLVRDDVICALPLSIIAALLPRAAAYSIYLSENAIWRLLRRSPQNNTADNLPYHLHPHVLYRLQQLKHANPHSVSYTPPNLVRSAFNLINALFPHQEQVVELFQLLVNLGHIPPHTLVNSSSLQTLNQIVGISLAKASLYWNWTSLAEDTLSRLLRSNPPPDSFTLKHTTDFIYALLISPSTSDLRRCLNMICTLHPFAPVLDGLVRQFYDCAVDLNATTLAEEMYNFSREPTVLNDHVYPPPQGRALSWLMLHLTRKSKKIHLARTLASDVVQGHVPIPVNTRAEFIAATAERGFATSARALWERYATGKDSTIIHGSSVLMLRMTNLFTSLARIIESKLEDMEEDIMGVVDLEAKLSNMRSFVDHIIGMYREHHEPWEKADHRTLTSYARACFIVGKNTEGFDTFKVLLNRKELPDLYDVNVALTVIAKQDLEAAAKMIERMTGHDVEADAVSIGTVLHHASMQRSTAVMEDMIKRALVSDDIYSDMKAFWTVIRAMAEPQDDETRERRVFKLENAWKLVHRSTERGMAPSLQLGNYLVTLAIDAQDARLAFKFWNALLRESGVWDDDQQRRQRRAIAQLTQAQNRLGEISGRHSRMIVSELQKREV